MELNEVGQRIFRVHRILISTMLVLGIGTALAAHHLLDARTYSATARITLGGATPQSTAEAAALAGTVQGIVTSPDRVTSALANAGLSRDPVRFAAKSINTQPFSASGVLQLTVVDTDPAGAAAVANTLASDAVTTLNTQSQRATSELRAQLQSEVTAVTAQLKALDAEVAASTLTGPQQTALLAQRSDLSQRLTALIAKQSDVQVQAAQLPQATIVDAAAVPDRPDPSRLPLDLVLGVIGGTVAGLGGAALRETVAPTAVGRRGIERSLGAPVLGTIRGSQVVDASKLLALRERVRSAARGARVSTVLLWSPRGPAEVTPLVSGLQPTPQEESGRRRARFEVAALNTAIPVEPRQGVLVVLRRFAPVSDLETAQDLCRDLGLPLLGALILEGRRGRPARSHAPATERHLATSALASS